VKKALVIDGSGFVYRAFFGYPKFSTSDGTPINAVYGVCSMVFSILSEFNYSNCVIALDRGRNTFRSQIYNDYKANREDAPDDLRVQFPIIREAYEAFGLHLAEKDGYEADDLIATFADKFVRDGYDEICIVSSDKDLMQLINDKVYMFDPMKKKKIDASGVVEKFGVNPSQIVDFLALLGDASDNVPGVDGVGLKTAAKLLNAYQNVEGIYENLSKISSRKVRESLVVNKDRLYLARKLVTLVKDVKCDQCDSSKCQIDYAKLIQFCNKYELKNLVKTIKNRIEAE